MDNICLKGGSRLPFAMLPSFFESMLWLWSTLEFSFPSSPCLGKDLGRNQKGMPASSKKAADTKKPSHQAPTQRVSFDVMVTVSEGEMPRGGNSV